MVTPLAAKLAAILVAADDWEVAHAVAAVVTPTGPLAVHGDTSWVTPWASVTKPATALAVMRAVERGELALDQPAGPPGSTIRHLLAHTSGFSFEGTNVLARPGTRRIYSNSGFDALGAILAATSGRSFEDALGDWVLDPLAMSTSRLVARPSDGLEGSILDLARLAQEFLRPTLLQAHSALAMRTVAFPGLPGVVPGIGRFDDCTWALGMEVRATKIPHWTGFTNDPSTFGHFGGAGTFMWIDPTLDAALVCLTDRLFGAWSMAAWPALSDAVVAALRTDDEPAT